MSTLRVSNIEAKADVSSPSVHEKIKVTNSEGDVLVHIDGATSGISTVGINTTVKTFDVDSNQNIDFVGNLTAPNITVTGTLSYDDVTNIDSVGVVTARSGISVTGGDILLTGGNGRKISFAGDGSAHYFKMDNTLNGPIINGYGGIVFETNGANERLRITSGGALHLGTTSSSFTELQIISSTSGISELRFADTTSNSGYVKYDHNSDYLALATSATERLRIRSDGKISAGTLLDTNNSYEFSIRGADGTGCLYAHGRNHYLSTRSTSHASLTLKKSNSDSDGIDYLQARDSSNAAKFVLNGDGTLQILDSIKHMGDTNTAIRFPADDTITAETGGSERLRITSGGTVYIGPNGSTFSSRGQLHIERALTYSDTNYRNSNLLTLENTTNDQETVQTFIGNYSGSNRYGNIIWTPGSSNDNSYFKINANIQDVNHLVVKGDGSIGIGTDNPDQKVEINGSVKFTRGTSTEGSQMLVLPLEDITLASNASATIPVGSRFTGIIIVAGYTNDTPGGVWAVASASSYSLDAVTNVILNNHPASNISNLTITSPSHGGTHQFQLNQTGTVTKTYKVFAMGVYG